MSHSKIGQLRLQMFIQQNVWTAEHSCRVVQKHGCKVKYATGWCSDKPLIIPGNVSTDDLAWLSSVQMMYSLCSSFDNIEPLLPCQRPLVFLCKIRFSWLFTITSLRLCWSGIHSEIKKITSPLLAITWTLDHILHESSTLDHIVHSVSVLHLTCPCLFTLTKLFHYYIYSIKIYKI